ncbi:MAG: glutaredoxin family protein [bacterium]|jgi:glutaredoxin|nr:glutaredoxin family protein [Betaproteobacteria bacterium]
MDTDRHDTRAGRVSRPRLAGASTAALAAAGALFLGLAFVPAGVDAQIRCWTNESGSRECSDLPPPANAKGVNEVRGRAGRIEGQESFAQRQAADRFPVTLWSNDCGEPCTNARKLLASRGVPFTDRNPALPALQEEFKKMTKGQMQVPLLIVGTSTLVGFEEGQWNSTLDAAGYARTPMPGRRPGTQAAAPQAQPPQRGGAPAQPAPPPRAPGAGPAGTGGSIPGQQVGPGGVVVPPQPVAGQGAQGSGFAPLPETSGGPGAPVVETFSPAGPAGGPSIPR